MNRAGSRESAAIRRTLQRSDVPVTQTYGTSEFVTVTYPAPEDNVDTAHIGGLGSDE